jgi:thiamine biosynthesis protein ThiI
VPFTDAQIAIRDNCGDEFTTIVMRRVMMYIAEALATRASCQALVTGESMGQVASQTIQSLAVTDCAASLPIFRPLIGMDKTEVIEAARRIGTYDVSILPYEDCCTLFTPKHPKTKPKLDEVLAQESRISNLPELVSRAVEGAEYLTVAPDK